MAHDDNSGSGAGSNPVPLPGKSAALAVALTWLLPGLGHFYLGWRRRAALYAFIILAMAAFGLMLEGSLSHPSGGSLLSALATVANMGVGPFYFVADKMGWGVGRVAAATHEIGNAFHWSAGVMNMLLMLDASDIARGRKSRHAKGTGE